MANTMAVWLPASWGVAAPPPGAVEQVQVIHAIGMGPRGDGLQRMQLRRAAGHHQLADAAMGDAALCAVRVERPSPLHAQRSLERARRVVQAGVDDLAVARAGLLAERLMTLDDDRLDAAAGQFARAGQPDDAGTDHYTIDTVCLLRHCRSSPSPATVSFLPGGTVR